MEERGASLTGEGLGFFDGKVGDAFSKSKRSYYFKVVGSKWKRGFSVTFSSPFPVAISPAFPYP